MNLFFFCFVFLQNTIVTMNFTKLLQWNEAGWFLNWRAHERQNVRKNENLRFKTYVSVFNTYTLDKTIRWYLVSEA